jgi:uncharacterized membrane protein
MESRVKFAGHAVHPMLIVFPLGLLVTAAAFDVLYLVTDRPRFATAAAFAIAAGVLGGGVAGLAGWLDWIAIPAGTRAKRVGLAHGVGNVVVLLLFAGSWLLRRGEPAWEPTGLGLALELVGLALGGVTGWLGGELVERLGIGVDEGANPNSPSSLTQHPRHKPA